MMPAMTQSNCVPGFLIDDDPPPPSKPTRAVTTPTPRSLIDNHEFLADCSRYLEGVYTRAQVKRRWRFDDATWDRLGDDNELLDAIELESTRRIRTGQAKIEKSQLLILKGPEILDSIATNPKANDKHKIDAIKTLNGLTGSPAEAEQQDRVIIKIDLSADTKDPKDIHIIEATPRPNVTPQEELPPPPRAITDYSDE